MQLIYLFFLFIVWCAPSFAWDNHALPTLKALEGSSLLPHKTVKVESLKSFLIAEERGLIRLFEENEKWANNKLREYKVLPAGLSFGLTQTKKDIRTRFLHALRFNPNYPFAEFVQEFPGRDERAQSLFLEAKQVTLLPDSLPTQSGRFIGLKEGEEVESILVFASSADEPDYGLDIGLWSDSESDVGKMYGFGPQPYGAKVEYSSQAPFHMGFYHEWGLLNLVADQLTDSYVEYRIHQFFTLANFAFRRGHEYWGYRFAGMGVHYIQDLTQPYHSTVMPGESTLYLLGTGILDQFGIDGPKNDLTQRAADEHTLIEKFAACMLARESSSKEQAVPLIQALKEPPQEKRYIYSLNYVRDILAKESNDHAEAAAYSLKSHLQFESAWAKGCSVSEHSPQQPVLELLFGNFARHTRSWIHSLV